MFGVGVGETAICDDELVKRIRIVVSRIFQNVHRVIMPQIHHVCAEKFRPSIWSFLIIDLHLQRRPLHRVGLILVSVLQAINLVTIDALSLLGLVEKFLGHFGSQKGNDVGERIVIATELEPILPERRPRVGKIAQWYRNIRQPVLRGIALIGCDRYGVRPRSHSTDGDDHGVECLMDVIVRVQADPIIAQGLDEGEGMIGWLRGATIEETIPVIRRSHPGTSRLRDERCERLHRSTVDDGGRLEQGRRGRFEQNAVQSHIVIYLLREQINNGMKLFELISIINTPRVLKEENLFELNFNDARIINNILDAPISCGFEAETIWPNVDQAARIENITSFYDSDLDDHISMRDKSQIESDFYDWLLESEQFNEAYSEAIEEYVKENTDDEDLQKEFLEYSNVDEDDIEEFKKDTLKDTKDKDSFAIYKNYSDDDWRVFYFEENLMSEFEDWLREHADEDGEIHQGALEEVNRNFDIDDWANYEYGGILGLLSNYDIFVDDDEAGLDEIAGYIRDWAGDESRFDGVEHGSYHAGAGNVTQDYWRVEEDTSISGPGAGAEIISPVYNTPREMLQEMVDLFEYFERQSVYTNRSTGLHVTMSMTESQGQDLNRLKVALLLGDRYLLKQFDRLENTYTKSQIKAITDYVRRFSTEHPEKVDTQTLQGLERLLRAGIHDDKFASSHFKGLKNTAGNTLVEFRIAGGNDYHTKLEAIKRSVIRYAVVLQAGYDREAYKKDYIRAIVKAFNRSQEITTDVNLDATDNEEYKKFLQAVSEIQSPSRDLIWHLKNAHWTLQGGNADASNMVNARREFLRTIGMIASDVAKLGPRNPITARRAMAIRSGFKEMGVTPKQMIHAFTTFDWVGNDELHLVIDGIKKMWGGRDIKSLNAEGLAREFKIDPADSALYVRKDLIDNPTAANRLTVEDAFRKIDTNIHSVYQKRKNLPKDHPDYEDGMRTVSVIEQNHGLGDNFVHVPWNTRYLKELFSAWEKRGVKVIPLN